MRRITLVFFYLLFTVTTLHAMPTQEDICEHNGINYKVAKDFYVKLQSLLRTDEKNKLASYVSFPLRVNERHGNKSKTYYVRNKDAFLSAYPTLFNNQMKTILMTSDVFCNYQGAALGNGNIWFRTTNDSAKIFVINAVEEPKKKK